MQQQHYHTPISMVKSEPPNGQRLSHVEQPKQVIHVRENSDTLTDRLFRIALNPNTNYSRPLRDRGLPDSFFHPRPQPTQLPPVHLRGHSSPAIVQHQHLVRRSAVHPRQKSCDILDESPSQLPSGWQKARTDKGELYYLDHANRRTVWEDPRKMAVDEDKPPLPPDIPPLPPGWGYDYDHREGRFYYMNHATQRTTWFHPLLPNKEEQVPQGQEKVYTQYLLNQNRPPQQQQVQQQMFPEQQQQYMEHPEMQQQQQYQQFQQQMNYMSPQQLHERQMAQQQAKLNQQQQMMAQLNFHQRQESADSGVSLRTPENYLGPSFDEMDTQEQPIVSAMNSNSFAMPSANPLDEIEPSLSVDMGNELSNVTIDSLTWL